MKPVKIERRKDRQKSNRKPPIVLHQTGYYTTAEEIEHVFIEHKPIKYFTVKV